MAAKYEQFPVVLEAMRECLQDVYDVAGLRELMTDVRSRRMRVVEVETPSASPFARSMLFGYAGMFLYDADQPLAERRAAALSLDSSLLAELLGSEAIRELLDADVLAEVERSLQRLDPDRAARHEEDAADLLRFLGDLSADEAARRGVRPAWLDELERQRRVIRVRIAGEERFMIIEDAGRVRDALGTALPVGVPEAFTEPVDDPLGDLLSRYARTHGPFPAGEAAARFGLGVAVVTGVLDRMVGTGRLVRGELRPGGTHTEYCDADVLRRLRRASLAKLRAEVEPVEPEALGRFLPAWHGVGKRLRTAPTADDVLSVVEQLAGRAVAGQRAGVADPAVPAARLLPRAARRADHGGRGHLVRHRLAGRRRRLDRRGPDGRGRPAAAGGRGGRPGDARCTRRCCPRWTVARCSSGSWSTARRRRCSTAARRRPTDADVVAALWDLVWAGLVTNDTIAPLRALVSGRGAAHKPRSSTPRGRYARLRGARPAMPSRTGPPTVAGRWSLVTAREPDPTRRAHARAEAFLERHGVLTRGALDTERVTRRLLRRVQGVARDGGVGPDRARLRGRGPGRVPVRGPRRGRPPARTVPFGR